MKGLKWRYSTVLAIFNAVVLILVVVAVLLSWLSPMPMPSPGDMNTTEPEGPHMSPSNLMGLNLQRGLMLSSVFPHLLHSFSISITLDS